MRALENIIDFRACPLDDKTFVRRCHRKLVSEGVATIPGFLTPTARKILISEANARHPDAFHTTMPHNVYLTNPDPTLSCDHIYNHQVVSSKACIATDQIPTSSALKLIYCSSEFRQFAAYVLGVEKLYEYADPLSSINVHYAGEGKELGWHFDNSAFAITLLLQAPEDGGTFEFVRDLRNSERGNMNFAGVADVIGGRIKPTPLDIQPGTLMIFRGRNSMHRVTPTIGKKTRILVVFAYNQEYGISLSESARMTFFGRLS